MRFYPNIPSRVFRHVPLVHGKDVSTVFKGVGLVRFAIFRLALSEDPCFCEVLTVSGFVENNFVTRPASWR